MQRLYFRISYLLGRTPWDTGITPPEITHLIEEEKLPPGRALDLGCGTGTNAIYLARQGWQVVGIDYVPRPIRIARRKARQAGVADRVKFSVNDVTQLYDTMSEERFDLAVDIGCGHSLTQEQMPSYADNLARLLRPGATFMLYMFRPTPERPTGLGPEAVKELFEPHFTLTWSNLGRDTSAGAGSAWYRFTRSG
ncbi:MAG: class I SAM-dependent methyltransferase [Anaerolineae bacterium]|nr:class I SAM-dependent methyltransferase [Anaerolineae bacterium]